jgi:hypothetical protein
MQTNVTAGSSLPPGLYIAEAPGIGRYKVVVRY